MFENRDIDLDPETLQPVLAISAGNSIYIAMPLACDPSERPRENEIKHITGNIGRPGVSIMIPPAAPKVRKLEENVWRLISHSPVEKRSEFGDSYKRTSLQLSFTRYDVPVGVRSHGLQDIEARFIETLVSIFDGDEWIADVDVLKALESKRLIRVEEPLKRNKGQTPSQKHCFNCRHVQHSTNHNVPPSMNLALIDSWFELLDKCSNPALLRAEGNKHARLAAAVLSLQLGHTPLLFKDKSSICWQCIEREIKCGFYQGELALSVHDKNGQVPTFIC
jgi:hypothetical protein